MASLKIGIFKLLKRKLKYGYLDDDYNEDDRPNHYLVKGETVAQ
jgi:hypothetical protein